MKKKEFYCGMPGMKYGIWNSMRKKFQFGICEDTPNLAWKNLFKKIGYDAYKWRFEVRRMPQKGISNG